MPTSVAHAHPLDPSRVATASKDEISADDAARLAGLLALLGDAIRVRILYALNLVDEQYQTWQDELKPALDAEGIHFLTRDSWTERQRGWLHDDRARFWGMVEKPREEIEEIYTWLQEQPHLAAYIVEIDREPVALFQTWDPEVDELGTFYERRPGDIGAHLFLADTPARQGRTETVLDFFIDEVIVKPMSPRYLLERVLARTRRQDHPVRSAAYHGPERRHRLTLPPAGVYARKSDNVIPLFGRPRQHELH